MEKNKMLKGAGIALIVIGALEAFVALLCFVGGELIAGIIGGEMGGDTALVTAAATILGVIFLIVAIAYIAAGVVGVKQKSPKTCFIVAIVLIVICGISAISSLIEGQWFSAIIILIAPVFYLVGAIQLKKAAADEAIIASNEDQNI